jgi:hypothetical protein
MMTVEQVMDAIKTDGTIIADSFDGVSTLMARGER